MPQSETERLPGGHACVRAHRCVRWHEPNAIDRDVEFIGTDLRENSQGCPVADLDLAGRQRDMALGRDAEPAVEPGVARRPAGSALRRGEARRGGAGAPARISAAARRTARTIRLCAPQRHRSASRARRGSRSRRVWSRANSAAALIYDAGDAQPHCIACSAIRADCSGCGAATVPRSLPPW